MAVIPFPLSSTRSRSIATLDVEAVDALTHQDFFQVIQTDAESGAAVISPEDEARLVQYLEFHGLRLPSAVKADQLRELCNTLRWTYGQAVRLAARNSTALAKECPGLNADKVAYACAVALQEHSLTREMARQVLKDRASLVFFY